MTGWGGMATQLRARVADQVMPIPDGMDFDTASAFHITYGTTLYALRNRANLKKGETLLVLGASGGTGSAAIELGKAMGATVIAAAGSDEKLEFCKKLGADHLINYSGKSPTELKKAINSIDDGVDVVYDAIGGPYAEPALRSMKWDGRYLVIGFAAGDIPKIPLNLALLKNCSIVGVFYGMWRFGNQEEAYK
jgi:NADPH2:quinone reductase